MQPHTGSLDSISLVAYNTGFNQPCFHSLDFIIASDSLEYNFRMNCQGMH